MNKNIIIGILIALCCTLLVALILNTNGSDIATDMQSTKSEKLSHPEIIKSANIHGLSLETPVQSIDEILANEPFKCRTNERENKTKDGKIYQNKFWTCSHNEFKGSALRIHVINNQIESIVRSGPSKRQNIEQAIAQLDTLKMKMKTLEGYSMNQTQNSTTFRIRHKKEDNNSTSMSYRTQLIPVRDPENPPKHDGMLNVSLVR